jgi:hypothetical protein
VAKVGHGQLGFNTGILSPQMSGRIDVDKYSRGCETLENFFPLVEGAAEKRSGTQFVKEVKDSTKATVLVPFEFSISQAYMLEFGDLYMRVHRDGGTVLETAQAMASAPTATNPVSIEVTGHSYSTGDEVWITGVALPVDMALINDRYFTITVTDPNNFTLDGEDGTGRSTSFGGSPTAARVHEVVTTIEEANLSTINFRQIADVLYMRSDNGVAKIIRVLDNSWTHTVLDFAAIEVAGVRKQAPPFHPLQLSTTTMIFDGGSTEALASAAFFDSSHIGRFIKIQDDADSWGYGLISSITSTTRAKLTPTVYNSFPAAVTVGTGTATRDWSLNAFNDTDGYPRGIALHGGRLWFGGTDTLPQTLWASRIDDYENFINYDSISGSVTESDGMQLTASAERLNTIEWIVGGEPLVFGTRDGEFTLAATFAETLRAETAEIRQRSRYGSRPSVLPASVDSVTFFVQRAGKKVREFVFQFETDRYVAPNMSRLARNVTEPGIIQIAFQQEPLRTLWAVMDDGTLASFVYEREDDVAAWSTHVLGGLAPLVESIGVIPSSDETSNELWMIVQRTVNGTQRRYIELLQQPWRDGDDIEDAWFLDCAVTGTPLINPTLSTLSGLHHLIGDTVAVFADGTVRDSAVVDADGDVAISGAQSTVATAGYPFIGKLKTMDIEAAAVGGISQGRLSHVWEMVLRLHQTGEGLFYGNDFTDMDELDLRDLDDLSDNPVEPFDGDSQIMVSPGGVTRERRLAIEHRLPFPCTVVAVFLGVDTREG